MALPDRDAALAAAARLASYACRTLTHASGRPWLLGCWPDDEAVTAQAGTARLAAIGRTSLTPHDLVARGPGVTGAAGSFHLLASVDGEVYARGTATGVRRLCTADADGVTFAADRAHTLAWLTGADPDPARLAARLLLPDPPFPIETSAMWRGVRAVQPGHALRLGRDGSVRTERWWRPPPSDLPLEQAATLLRDALRAAVAVRVRPGDVWGADLSGGMDSTSACFLAHEAGADLVAVTLEWSAAGNEDARHAREAARHLPGITHFVLPSSELPGHFSGLGERHPPGDEPSVLLRDRAQQSELAGLLRDHGVRGRLSGHGGDHVVTPLPAYLHPLLRRRPLTGLAHLAAHRARSRWPLVATLRQLVSRPSLAAWIREQADALGPLRRGEPPMCGWGFPVALPPWATGRARDLAAGLLREAADRDGVPLGPDRGTHAWVHLARLAGSTATHLSAWGAVDGLPVETPFCDDAVLDACLRVRPEDAGHPAVYKPLLAAAMRGIVPEAILTRTTKDHCGDEWYAGLATQRRTLAAWTADSRLAAAGLADPAALRRAVLAPGLLNGGVCELEPTLGIEEWLRDLEARPHPHHLKEHPHEPAPAATP
ncbi:asparagine synthase [Streptomyces sp. SA15]|nr:asparagine synthase [Streptomyces sp. SA15]